MAFRTMVAPFLAASAQKPGIEHAILVAGRLGAHLDAVFVRPDPEEVFAYTGFWPAHAEWAESELRQRIDEQGKAAAERIRRRFASACRKADLPKLRRPEAGSRASAGWQEAKGDPLFAVPDLARTADMAIFTGGGAASDMRFENVLEATLLRSGRPVLFLPEEANEEPQFARPLIAWDGGSAAARAVAAWLASGLGADTATVLHLSEASGEAPNLEGVVRHLAWHGIAAEAEVRPRGPDALGDALLAVAAEGGAGLIVMGGYGHFRFREAMFGGVTRHVIRHSSIPVLMMH